MVGWHWVQRTTLLKSYAEGSNSTGALSRFLHSVSRWQQRVGVVFDIDGVLLRGKTLIEGASAALRQLHGEKIGEAGGGVTEATKAQELASLLDVPVTESQVILGHTPFKKYVERYRDQRILSVGKGDTRKVMQAYGFRHVVPIEDYVHEFPDMDPLAPYGPARQTEARIPPHHPSELRRIAAVFVVSDPVNWGRDIQVLCDVLRSGGLPGHTDASHAPQIPLFLAADDFEYQAKFAVPRFGMGAFRIALESLYNRLSNKPLSHVAYGKPSPEPFRFALEALRQQHRELFNESLNFDRVYMVGDNPKTDIQGALNAGHPWHPILTRTKVYRGHHYAHKSPVHGPGKDFPHSSETLVVPTVAEAVEHVLEASKQPQIVRTSMSHD